MFKLLKRDDHQSGRKWTVLLTKVDEYGLKKTFTRMALGRNKTGNLQGVGEILFWPVHVKEHVRIIGQCRKIRSRPRSFAWVNRFWNFKPQNFASVATVMWIVGSSKFWYQYDRIYVVFYWMDSDFQILNKWIIISAPMPCQFEQFNAHTKIFSFRQAQYSRVIVTVHNPLWCTNIILLTI